MCSAYRTMQYSDLGPEAMVPGQFAPFGSTTRLELAHERSLVE